MNRLDADLLNGRQAKLCDNRRRWECQSQFWKGACLAWTAIWLMFTAVGCSSEEKPRPIKSSVPTCCQGK